MKKSVFVLVMILVLGSGIWWLKRPKPIEVRLTPIERGTVEATVANTRAGTIKACQRSELSLSSGGQVVEQLVKAGDRVQRGQVLLQLRNNEQQALLQQAAAQLQMARQRKEEICFGADRDQRDADRQSRLYKQKLSSEEAFDSARTKATMSHLACAAAETQIAEADASLKLRQALYDQTFLRAPFAGVVAEVNGELGEYVTPSPPGVPTLPAIDLIDDSCLYVEAPIDEVDAAAIHVGMPARVTLDAFRGRHFNGQVTRIAPYVKDLEKQARTVDIDVKLDTPPQDITLLIGYSADIEVILQRHDEVLKVATEAVLEGNRVLLYNPQTSTLEEHAFTPGLSNWVSTEIKQGLQEGQQVLVSLDVAGAVAGAKVKPKSQPDPKP